MVIGLSIIGYAGFLLRYPNPHKGDTIKASYLLHIFPLVAVLGGEFLQSLRRKSPHGYLGLMILWSISLLHNAPVFLTRYRQWLW
jgi:hypothetical protein